MSGFRYIVGLYTQAAFYLFAGLNHFINPAFYLDLIPKYLPYHEGINFLSGAVEIAFAFGLLWVQSRRWAALGIVLMLVAFVPSHVYFINIGGCVANGLCVPLWVGWLRLVIVHPLLMWWAWRYFSSTKSSRINEKTEN